MEKIMVLGGMGYGMSVGGNMMAEQQIGFLSKMPIWLSTIIMLVAILIIGLLLGKIIGKIIGNIVYPDPEKETVFNLKQRITIVSIVVATLAISGAVIYISQKPPKDDIIAVDGPMVENQIQDNSNQNNISNENDIDIEIEVEEKDNIENNDVSSNVEESNITNDEISEEANEKLDNETENITDKTSSENTAQ